MKKLKNFKPNLRKRDKKKPERSIIKLIEEVRSFILNLNPNTNKEWCTHTNSNKSTINNHNTARRIWERRCPWEDQSMQVLRLNTPSYDQSLIEIKQLNEMKVNKLIWFLKVSIFIAVVLHNEPLHVLNGDFSFVISIKNSCEWGYVSGSRVKLLVHWTV